ncbi:hypothetical protein NQ176_g9947 [Zarea fungicola]|uniref:Uncharacterized protein n=1 Tax=Zarea fungicola TaxID=93591 RepID=A0ACC1MJP5_9HYPO|nr:hypothetical protein NQ176_g9947 [Lecanicillium fungicola]
MYGKYLDRFRDGRVKLLEIGLGCDVPYGPGASYRTWRDFFPNLDLYFIENNVQCTHHWAELEWLPGTTIFLGDQGDPNFLDYFVESTRGEFDVIVDDGGHHMHEQITSFLHLWRALEPGGVYICEDLETSYFPMFHGDASTNDSSKYTMTKFIFELLDDKMISGTGTKHRISQEIHSIECMKEICAFVKASKTDLLKITDEPQYTIIP